MMSRLCPTAALRKPSKKVVQAITSHMMCTSTNHDQDDVLFEQVNSTGIIQLNRPKSLNSLNLSMIKKIYPTILRWEDKDSGVKQVIIKGGDKAFCAGGDIVAITDSAKAKTSLCRQFFYEEYILNNKIATYSLPYIAVIDGITMGGGVGLSIHGRYRIATERTMVAMPETAIGLFADVGSAYPLSRLPGHLGAFLTLTGYRLKGRDVHYTGIASHYVKSHLLEEMTKSLTNLTSPNHESISQIIEGFQSQSIDSTDKFTLKPHLDKISTIFGHKNMEEIMDALDKDGTEWSKKQLSLLQSMSPTSMKITLRHLIESADASTVADVLCNDNRLANRAVDNHDFTEGVRSKLIDKDNKPRWQPPTVREVTPEIVNHYFSPLPNGTDWTPAKVGWSN